ncbi:T9SS type A sorting domain-containing protein [Lewinella sp. W8]|uniref:T9SS type A sorting domain-containing protein n=1 Tax=Lewinella sp. W8 TaxID=2528208 RepID=UPI00106850A0|nr:T9SS type A sorting domain-containing protein [Lewinella sp. W8]MTB51084.1 T9SS type A sorting domain-containing protein [Lewinella sp. W8]
MHKFYLAVLLFCSISYTGFGQVTLPIDFEDSEVTYAINGFEGGEGSVIANPDPSGINTSANVGQYVKGAGADFAGVSIPLDGNIDFGENNAIKMKVWSNRVGARVLFKLDPSGGDQVEVATTVASEWEELTFDLGLFTGGSYNTITLILDLGTAGDGSADFTLFFDDIELTTLSTEGGVQLPITFEDSEVNYTFNGFEGGEGSVIANPDPSGINTSANVGQYVKGAGADFAGITIPLAGVIDFGENNAMKMKVWSNRVGARVLFKLEPSGGDQVEVATTVANEWEELTFDLSLYANGNYNAITLILDLGTAGDGSADFTLFFDDIELTTLSTEGGVQLPITFEDSEVNYTFNGFEGGEGSVIANPDPSGINTSANVGQYVKGAGADFAGITIPLAGVIDFGENNAVKMKVWSNRVGARVLFKLEPSGGDQVEVATTVASEWEELTFDVSAFTGGNYNAITLILDLGTAGDGSADFTLFFDDIELTTLSTEGGVELPITFEDSEVTYAINGFEGGEGSVIANPDPSGINTSATVGQYIKGTGAVFAGVSIPLAGPIDFGENNAIKMKVWSNRVGARVLFKLDPSANDEVEVATTVASEWEELTFDVSAFTGGSYDVVTLILDLGTAGDGSADFTLFFDDIELTTLSTEGGVELPITFEDSEVTYAINGFEGGEGSVIANPDPSGINTSATVGQYIKGTGAVFAGVSIPLAGPIDFGENNAIKMKVWSNRVGARVLFKLDPSANDEVEVATTVASEWEELTFDVSAFTGGSYDVVTLILDLGTAGDGSADFTLFFDDIELTTITTEEGVQLPITFEDSEVTYAINGFEGGEGSVIANPDPSGINTSANVGQYVKGAGAEFAGVSIPLDGPIDFGENNAIKMKVWSNRVGARVLFKLDPSANDEVEVATTVASEWEELTFDVSAFTGGSYNVVTLILDLGTAGDGSADFTLFFDDIELTTIEAEEGVQLPITFEDSELMYAINGFEGGEGSVIANPDPSGINTSANVGQYIKGAGAEFAGVSIPLDGPIEFGDNDLVKMKVWSNRVGARVLFKLDPSANDEVEVATTVANEWEELTFDVSAFTGGSYNVVTLILDLGTAGDGSADFTLFFDDIVLADSTTSVRNLTAEDVQVFPNPTSSQWQINSPESRIEVVNLFDLSGKLLMAAKPGTNQFEINAQQFPQGTYLLSVTTTAGRRIARLIKQ